MCIHFINIQKTEGNVRSPQTVVRNGCEQSRGYWLLDPGLLQEQPMFLSTELFFQPPNVLIVSYESYVFKIPFEMINSFKQFLNLLCSDLSEELLSMASITL